MSSINLKIQKSRLIEANILLDLLSLIDAYTPEDLEYIISSKNFEMYSAYYEGELAGVILISKIKQPVIEALSVFEDFRKKGIGRALINHIKTRPLIASPLKKSIAFYEKLRIC